MIKRVPRKIISVAFLTTLLFSNISEAQDWKWIGFEVIGHHKTTKSEILSRIPVAVGDNYKEDPDEWEKWCSDLKKHFKFHFTQCSAVRFINFQAYFVVEIIETGYEHRNQFRPNPTESIPFASQEITDLYERLYKRLFDLFNQGIGVHESTDKGYLDYADPEMHTLVEKLTKRVPKHRDNLIKVLEKDKDVNKREKAANLLNWTVNDLPNSVVRANRNLDDPSGLVRNNISRFTLHFIKKVSSPKDRHGLIDRLLVQLDRPSHGDRNKAIYNLVSVAQAFPMDRPYIKSKGYSLVEYTAKNSVLENVRDPAKQLLDLMNEKVK